MPDHHYSGNGNGGNDNGKNGKRLEMAAESAALKFVARWMMAVGVPAFAALFFAVGSWWVSKIMITNEENTKSIIKLEETVKALVNSQLPAMSQAMNSRFDAHVQRLDSIDRRNDTQDVKIDTIQRDMYRAPRGGNYVPDPSHDQSGGLRPYPSPR